MRVILAGGGTAGHINPALAIADTIKKHSPESEFLFVGRKNGMEGTLVPKVGYKMDYIDVRGIKRKLTPENLMAIFKAASASIKCRKIVKKFKPDIVIGTGGYVSGPMLLAAASMNIPTLIHEQNVFAGMTSRMLSKKVDTVCIAFEKARNAFPDAKKVVLTGNPLRAELFDSNRIDARIKLCLDSKPFVVVFGGSLGAEKINETMTEYVKSMDADDYNILFATGEREYDKVLESLNGVDKKSVKVVKYIYNMNEVMQAADLLVCRAGAITVSEITALGKPAVLIPSPNVTDNHQYHNAKAVADNNGAVLLEEKDLDVKAFAETMESLLANDVRLAEMSVNAKKMAITDATEIIYGEIEKLTRG